MKMGHEPTIETWAFSNKSDMMWAYQHGYPWKNHHLQWCCGDVIDLGIYKEKYSLGNINSLLWYMLHLGGWYDSCVETCWWCSTPQTVDHVDHHQRVNWSIHQPHHILFIIIFSKYTHYNPIIQNGSDFVTQHSAEQLSKLAASELSCVQPSWTSPRSTSFADFPAGPVPSAVQACKCCKAPCATAPIFSTLARFIFSWYTT